MDPKTEALIRQKANQYSVDPELAIAVARQESGLDNTARSKKGALGVFQLMPRTAKELGVNPTVLHENIDGGVRYLKKLLQQFSGNLPVALGAYNFGPGNVDTLRSRFGTEWLAHAPEETKNYVRRITAAYKPQPLPASPRVTVQARQEPTAAPPVMAAVQQPEPMMPSLVPGVGSVPEMLSTQMSIPAAPPRPMPTPPTISPGLPSNVQLTSFSPVNTPPPPPVDIPKNTRTSYLQRLQEPATKAKFDAMPETAKRAVMKAIWQREVKPKLNTGNLQLSDQELQSAKETFVDRYIKAQSKGPLYSEPTPSAGQNVGGFSKLMPLVQGAMEPMAWAAERVGKATGLEPGGGFRQLADASKEAGAEFTTAHPFVAGFEKSVPALAAAGGLEALAGPAIAETMGASKVGQLAAKAAVGGLGFVPFAETPGDIPKEFATGAVLGPTVSWLFGLGGKAASKTLAAAKSTATKAAEKLGPASDAFKDTFAQFKANEALRTAEANAKKAQTVVEAFTKKYGTPTEEQLNAIKAGGKESKDVFKAAEAALKKTTAEQKSANAVTEKAIKIADASARAKLVKQRVGAIRKTSKVITPDQITQIGKDVQAMTLEDVNKEILGAAKPATATTSVKTATPTPPVKQAATQVSDVVRSPQEERRLLGAIGDKTRKGFDYWMMSEHGLTPEQFKTVPATKREQFVQQWKATKYYEAAAEAIKSMKSLGTQAVAATQAERPDIAKAVEALAPAEQQAVPASSIAPAVTKVATEPVAVTLKNKTGEVVNILTPEEAKLATNVDIALKRLREQAVADVQNGMSAKGLDAKYGGMIKFFQQEGMSVKLQEDFANAVKDIPTTGRPTKVAAAAKPSEVRAVETKQRKAEAVSEKKKAVSRALADEAGPDIKYDDKLQAFKERWKRQPNAAERVFLSKDDVSIGQAVDQDIQLDFENAHPEVFGD